ncbi:(2Fe-2S)-binding protein [Streptomyces fragilis]|uniref:(2Fe-2S)-binding protein n=1 Tax=Streptomyces fragilis TaxID=67301 RepID=A0ABV2YH88_9ACTN|nr:(2Fe-2S)-binding protein [Streptomyces fragilis]
MPFVTSAFQDAYDRLASAFPHLTVTEVAPGEPLPTERADAGPGWAASARFAEDGPEVAGLIARDGAMVEQYYGRPPRPDVGASLALHRYAWPVCLLFTIPAFLSRRVPRLSVDDVAVHLETGRIVVRPRTFACLPGDPAAALPGARVVPDEDALRAEVRAAAAEHLGPVLDVFGPRMRRRGRSLWGMVTDEMVEGLWYVGNLLGEERRAVEELGRMLPGATLPLPGAAAFRELPGPDGDPLTTRDRVTCCLAYTLAENSTCVTCPRTCDTERIAKLTAVPAA